MPSNPANPENPDGSILTGIPIGGTEGTGANQTLTPETTTVESVKSWINVSEDAQVEIVTPGGTVVSDSHPIGTGMIIEVIEDGEVTQATTVIVKGDVLGTGVMNIAQVVRLAQDLNGLDPLEGVYKQAGIFGSGDTITIADIVQSARLLVSMGGSITR